MDAGGSFGDFLPGAVQTEGRSNGVPIWLAVLSVVASLAGLLLGLLCSGSAAWSGWAVGFSGILAAIAYRILNRSRAARADYQGDYRVDRLMLAGALLGLAAVLVSAWTISQRVVA